MIIDPRGFDSVVTWSDFMRPLIEKQNGVILRLDDPDEWQEWAVYSLLGDASTYGQNVPDPYDYTDWREWAMRLFATINFEG